MPRVLSLFPSMKAGFWMSSARLREESNVAWDPERKRRDSESRLVFESGPEPGRGQGPCFQDEGSRDPEWLRRARLAWRRLPEGQPGAIWPGGTLP